MNLNSTVLLACLVVTVASVTLAVYSPFPPTVEHQKWTNSLLEPFADSSTVSYRLPNNTKPEAYNITLRTWINEGNFNFTGTVVIRLNATENTSNITLHYRQLNITGTELFAANGTQLQINSTTYNNITEFYTIFLSRPLLRDNKYTLIIKYAGILRTGNAGVFRQSYMVNGERRWLLATHFETTNARHGFPCYDEPALKALISVNIIHDKSYKAVSNTPEIKQSPKINDDGSITTSFEQTPLMSTYLTAFAVTDYANNSRQAITPPLNRVLARQDRINETDLMLNFGVDVLEKIGEYVGVNFSLPKMDQIAVPTFGGAMENWGLVVYGDYWAFYNKSTAPLRLREDITSIVAHEFGHQWFGNLVSPLWWTYSWLNEGFANYFGYKGVELVDPNMQMMDLYVINNIQSVLNVDATEYTRPMTHYAESPAGLGGLFDNIAYAKSGSVIHMFINAFGEKTFRKGLKYYLNAKAYSAAAEEDLFDALERAVKEDNTLPPRYDVPTIMSSWTRQKGFPILNVTVLDNGDIQVIQERYFNNATLKDENSLWWIPYNYITGRDAGTAVTSTFPDGWIYNKISRIQPPQSRQLRANDWVVFNKQHTGYYRVLYNRRNYKLLSDSLSSNSSILHYLTVTQLLDDAYHFVQTGRSEYDVILDLLRTLSDQTEYAPWSVAYRIITSLDLKLAGTSQYNRFQKFMQKILTTFFDATGVENVDDEPYLRKFSRLEVIREACLYGVPSCINQAHNKLKSLIANGTTYHRYVRNSLTCASLRNATADEFNTIWKQTNASGDANLRNLNLEALSCVRSSALLKTYLHSSLQSTNVNNVQYRFGEQFLVISSVSQSGEVGLSLAIRFIAENANEVRRTFMRHYLNNLISGIAKRITSQRLLKEFNILLISLGNSIDSGDMVKIVVDNLAWNSRHLGLINQWLIENISL